MKGDLRLRQSDDLELVERMAEAGWNANPGRPAALTWACRESALMRKEAYELRQMMQAALRVVHAAWSKTMPEDPNHYCL
jgi:hypothetical protein